LKIRNDKEAWWFSSGWTGQSIGSVDELIRPALALNYSSGPRPWPRTKYLAP
jgi:hypothetical protein